MTYCHRVVEASTSRLTGSGRKNALVDAAAALLEHDGLDAVSMENVAAGAGVSRALVYKHFANRGALLAEVFRREATQLDAEIAAEVEAAETFEGKIRALIRAVIETMSSHGAVFAPLLKARVGDARFREEQRARDRRTVRFFSRLAMREVDVSETEARAAMSILLVGLESVRAQWKARPTPERKRELEDVYVALVLGGLARLGARPSTEAAGGLR